MVYKTIKNKTKIFYNLLLHEINSTGVFTYFGTQTNRVFSSATTIKVYWHLKFKRFTNIFKDMLYSSFNPSSNNVLNDFSEPHFGLFNYLSFLACFKLKFEFLKVFLIKFYD